METGVATALTLLLNSGRLYEPRLIAWEINKGEKHLMRPTRFGEWDECTRLSDVLETVIFWKMQP